MSSYLARVIAYKLVTVMFALLSLRQSITSIYTGTRVPTTYLLGNENKNQSSLLLIITSLT